MSNGNGDSSSEWDEDDVLAILLNPIHTMGNSPTVSSEDWISAQTRLIDELGVNTYLSRLLSTIQQTFGDVVE